MVFKWVRIFHQSTFRSVLVCFHVLTVLAYTWLFTQIVQESGNRFWVGTLLQFRSMSMLFWFVHAPMNAAFPWLSAPKVSGKLWGKKRLPQISALLGSFNWKRIVKREWGPSLDQRFGAPKEIQENSQNQSYMVTIIISLYLLMGRSYDPMKKPGVFYRVAFLVFPLWRFRGPNPRFLYSKHPFWDANGRYTSQSPNGDIMDSPRKCVKFWLQKKKSGSFSNNNNKQPVKTRNGKIYF